MRLKQIKLAGFKSFVDPTTVTLPGNRCAVVGPNGCGKSNIIDAVRWVMGESSAKQLRGENLTDVIFNGSNARQPTAVASIELIFDNSDGRIGGEYAAYTDIAIRRQVNRESQSHYFLNGEKCRRRDIMDIFLGTGFGPRSYSIIEQGMISQLVEAKPEELRVYLEEAAGISKYKERRRETENRVKHTRENLSRLSDIREELAKRLEHLQKQAKAAERYEELKESERKLKAEFHSVRLIALKSMIDDRKKIVGGLEMELAAYQSEYQSYETAIEKGRLNQEEIGERLNSAQGRFYEIGSDVARIEGSIKFNQDRVEQLEQDLESLGVRENETVRQLSEDDQRLVRLQDEIDQIAPALDDAALKDDQSYSAQASLAERYQKYQHDWELYREEDASNQREIEVQESRIEHLEQILQRLRSRFEQLELDATSNETPVSHEVDSLASEIGQIENRRSILEKQIDDCLQELSIVRESIIRQEGDLEEARDKLNELRHEIANLQGAQQAALGQGQEFTDDWITAQGLGAHKRLGEALSVISGWEHAVEHVLPGYLSGIQDSDLNEYKDKLIAMGSGSVTLLEARVESTTHGELPLLASFIRGDGLQLGSILHGVFAAESADVAFDVRKRLAPGDSIVTRDGLWLGPDWLKVLPKMDASSGIIERTQILETLVDRMERSQEELASSQGDLSKAKNKAENLEVLREDLQKQVNTLNAELAEMRTNHGVRQVQIEEADARRDRLISESREIQSQIKDENERLALARDALKLAESLRENKMAEGANIARDKSLAESDLVKARENSREARDKYHTLNSNMETLRSQLLSNQTARDRLLKQHQDLQEQIRSVTSAIAGSSVPLPKLKEDLNQELEARLGCEAEIADIRGELEKVDTDIREIESTKVEAENRLENVRGKLEETRLDEHGLSIEEKNVKEAISVTGFSFEDILETLPEDATEEAWAESLEKMDKRIQRLGPINLAAIDEFEEESQRKTYLDQQNGDLEEALDTLLTAIRKIDKETRSRFRTTFDTVNQHLGELFPKVFGGGTAYLELTGEDLLDTGVTLMARPPGKRNSSIHLLSGGEKAMTAVALIFAIFRINPSPVCLLDEVDAPLDDSNVMRFADLIREMSADVQFLVITHNKLTMEMADHLMGVTMNEPGVSRLVSVDVEAAAAMAS